MKEESQKEEDHNNSSLSPANNTTSFVSRMHGGLGGREGRNLGDTSYDDGPSYQSKYNVT